MPQHRRIASWSVVSMDGRNTCVKTFCRRDRTQLCLTMYRYTRSFWNVLSQQTLSCFCSNPVAMANEARRKNVQVGRGQKTATLNLPNRLQVALFDPGTSRYQSSSCARWAPLRINLQHANIAIRDWRAVGISLKRMESAELAILDLCPVDAPMRGRQGHVFDRSFTRH